MKKINIWYLCIALIAATGVGIQLFKNGVNMLLYFTTLSNSFVALFYALVTFDKRFERFKGSVVMAILLTGLVYHFMLSPRVSPASFHRIENYIVHYIVPVIVSVDFLIDKKQRFKWTHPFYWTIFPLLYFGFSLVNGLVLKWTIPNNPDSPFPYFFLNVDKLGFSKVLYTAAILCGAYVVGGYIIILIKKIVKRI